MFQHLAHNALASGDISSEAYDILSRPTTHFSSPLWSFRFITIVFRAT
jgi:hypothetical protein